MKLSFILLLFLLASCHYTKTELEIKIIDDPSLHFWKNNNVACFKSKSENEIKLTLSLLSTQKIPQNTYNYGIDTIKITSLCNYDALVLKPTDLIIDSKTLTEYFKIFPYLLSTNLYVKFNMKGFNKYILKEINSKRIALYCVIADSNSPLRSFHIEDYRIENPAYEINKINSKIKPHKYIVILLTNDEINNKKSEYFYTLIQNLNPKPHIIFAKTNKLIKIEKTLIYPLPQDASNIKIIKTFGFEKLRKEELKSEINWQEINELNQIRKKTDEEFNKKLCILTKSLSDTDLTKIIAKGVANFLYSDLVIIPSDILLSALFQGEVTHKDIYRILKNPEDKLVYIKIKGENISHIINNFSKISTMYINSRNIINEKPFFLNSKTYRIITTLDFIKKNDEILNYIMEFTVLNIKIKQPIIWYFKTQKRI